MINEIFFMFLCLLALILILPFSAFISKIITLLFSKLFGGKNGK